VTPRRHGAIQRDINMAGQNLRNATVLHDPRDGILMNRDKGLNAGKRGISKPG
jgi:hypothetical protein